MTERFFLDTNVILYADDRSAGDKRLRSLELLRDLVGQARAVISTQVLQEYFVVATRKLGVTPELARAKVDALAQLDVVLIRPEIIVGAIDLHRLHSLSFWDALIIKCASVSGCSRVLSEDMQDGVSIDGVTVVNPF